MRCVQFARHSGLEYAIDLSHPELLIAHDKRRSPQRGHRSKADFIPHMCASRQGDKQCIASMFTS